MKKEQAIEIAKQFIRRYNETSPLPGDYAYDVEPDVDPNDFVDYWYFDFKIKRKDNHPLQSFESIAGAPGYIISKSTGEVSVVSWLAYQTLKEKVKH